MSQRDVVGLIALDAACLLAAVMMVRAWLRRRTRPPLVVAAFVVALGIVASALVMAGIEYGLVVGPTFIIALLVIMYTARYERRVRAADGVGAGDQPERRPSDRR